MESLSKLSRRGLDEIGRHLSRDRPGFTRSSAQDAGSEAGRLGVVGGRAEEELYPGKGLPGGGQLEIRLSASIYTSDADQLEVAQRMKPFNLASWIEEWTRVAERNEKLAEKFAGEGLKVTANEYYSRASNFYREACWPMPVTEARMIPALQENAGDIRQGVAADAAAFRARSGELPRADAGWVFQKAERPGG